MTKEVVETTASTSVTSKHKVASHTIFIEEITPYLKRTRGNDKGKSKADFSVWDDVITALGRAHNIIILDELKSLSTIPFHKLVNHYIHKLVQVLFGPNSFLLKFALHFLSFLFLEVILTSFLFYQVLGETIHITIEYLTNEEKVVMTSSKVDALKLENSNLRKEQIKALIDDIRAEKLLTVQKDEQLQAANCEVSREGDNVVQAFQLADEYNGILLSWYFKGFELLRRYLTKHKPRVDLEGLDFEAVDKEMEAKEANAVEGVAPYAAGDEGAIAGDDPVV